MLVPENDDDDDDDDDDKRRPFNFPCHIIIGDGVSDNRYVLSEGQIFRKFIRDHFSNKSRYNTHYYCYQIASHILLSKIDMFTIDGQF